jgi:protein-serine/threonine kinase
MSIVLRGYALLREEGLKSFLWPKRWLILREQTLTFHRSEENPQALNLVFLKEVVRIERIDTRDYAICIETRDKTFEVAFKSDEELYSWMDAIYERSPLGISSPTNFSHNVHVGFDQNSGVFTVLETNQGTPQTMEESVATIKHHTGRDCEKSESCLGCIGLLH